MYSMYVSCEKDEEVHETHPGICYIYIYVYNLSEIGIEEWFNLQSDFWGISSYRKFWNALRRLPSLIPRHKLQTVYS